MTEANTTRVRLTTPHGDMVVEFFPDKAPNLSLIHI